MVRFAKRIEPALPDFSAKISLKLAPMHKLSPSGCGHLCSSLRNFFKGHKTLSSITLFSTCAETVGPKSKLEFIINEVEELQCSKSTTQITQTAPETENSSILSLSTKPERMSVQISHPWPEWVDLMECLLKRGCIEGGRAPFGIGEAGDAKERNLIRTACLNFARDRYDLIRFLSRKDIQLIVGFGCPTIDRKVVNSGKRLRAHVGIDEGNVCSSCNLRGDCERAYVKARQDESGRTVDVMRILLTYGLDRITGTVENKLGSNRLLTESVRRLLKEMVEYSSTKELDSDLPKATPLKRQGDWICPKCSFINFAKNIKCLRCDGLFHERLKQLREVQDHLPLKKGDWICDKCNFLNFAKNTRCLQCKENPPKRQLNPGEWECDSCNYINFRRNIVCLKCDFRRPKAFNASNPSNQPQQDNGGYCNQSEMSSIRAKANVNDQASVGRNRKSLEMGSNIWRFVDDSSDYVNKREMSIVRAKANVNYQASVGRNRKSRETGSNMWRFVDDSNDSACSSACNDDSGFLDFPISGGKSDLSQDEQRRERWKLEMLQRRKGTITASPEDDEFRSANFPRKLDFPESTDDEELAEWFGHGKTERKACSTT
ncbi:zinc finger protein VAR3, chloroplastic-like [Juglans microcarpa x Juglans regia]|uniref:zinc finger protein VAR3, chloroplastic-like n=1 Tax=Juglans microcarpa x Juglans regia TaxID=2249226 RepID=UPI001B7EAAAB|nr:zinc finger protein VAR3, chloroplastic-like [Juglans microcarpa x Juglans regia]